MPNEAWTDFLGERLSPELLSVLMLVALSTTTLSLLVAPFILQRLPTDYFARTIAHKKSWSTGALAVRILRNLLAAALFLLGIALLSLPGPGIVTILLALGLSDLPIRTRLFRWVMQRPKLRRTVDRLRVRVGKKPLEF